MEAEAAHGTVTRHYRQHQKGEIDLDQLDGLDLRLDRAASRTAPSWTTTRSWPASPPLLEKVSIDTVEGGFMTKDLALLVGAEQGWLTTEGFLDKVSENLTKAMAEA